jgi:hypothetical protein
MARWPVDPRRRQTRPLVPPLRLARKRSSQWPPARGAATTAVDDERARTSRLLLRRETSGLMRLARGVARCRVGRAATVRRAPAKALTERRYGVTSSPGGDWAVDGSERPITRASGAICGNPIPLATSRDARSPLAIGPGVAILCSPHTREVAGSSPLKKAPPAGFRFQAACRSSASTGGVGAVCPLSASPAPGHGSAPPGGAGGPRTLWCSPRAGRGR